MFSVSFHRFSGEKPVGLYEILVFGGSLHGKLNGEACILRCVYFFICSLFVYLLFVCVFAFYLLLRSGVLGHASVMWFNTVGRGSLFLWSCLAVLVG